MSSNLKRRLQELIYLSKRYPVIGAEKLIGLNLPYYQQDMIERLWTKKRPFLLCSRRTGKTFITAAYLALKALLYENMAIGITAPVFRQSQTAFLEVEKIYRGSPLLRAEARGRPKHRPTGWILEFKNGSSIECVPLNENIRSKGYHIIFVDEYGFQFRKSMNSMLENILIPMTFTKRPGVDNDPTDIGNQIIISSTATFKWNDYYKKYCEYLDKIEKGNEMYDIISYDYRDGLQSGIFEEQLVKDEYENADPLTRKMEYLNIFPDDTGGFITYKLLSENAIDQAEVVDEEKDIYEEPKTTIEFEQEYDENGLPKHKYMMAFDDADTGPNNFAVSLIKIDGDVKRLVRVITTHKAFIEEKIDLVRDLLRKFNVMMIVCDQRHKNIKDNLAEPYEYKDGETGEIIIDMDDDEQKKYIQNKYGSKADVKELIRVHNFSASSNEIRARHFLSQIEKGKFKIPADPRGGYESKKEEEAYNEIKQAIFEITSVKAKPHQSIVRYEPEDRNQNKDRWTVCELGCFMADEYLKELAGKGNSNNFVLGKWSR